MARRLAEEEDQGFLYTQCICMMMMRRRCELVAHSSWLAAGGSRLYGRGSKKLAACGSWIE